jgi:hypothetical protein
MVCPMYKELRQKYCIKPAAGCYDDSVAGFIDIMCTGNHTGWFNLAGFLGEAFETRDKAKIKT